MSLIGFMVLVPFAFDFFCGLIRRDFLRSGRERGDAAGDDGESVCKFQSF